MLDIVILVLYLIMCAIVIFVATIVTNNGVLWSIMITIMSVGVILIQLKLWGRKK